MRDRHADVIDILRASGRWRFFVVFGVIFAALFFVLAPVVWVESIHHDNTRYFRYVQAENGQTACPQDGQFAWLHAIGRPVTAVVECAVFLSTHSFANLATLRVVTIGFLALSGAVLALWLGRLGIPIVAAAAASASIFMLPGPQNSAFMTNLPNAITPLLAISAYVVLPQKLPDRASLWAWIGSIFGSFVLLTLAVFTYPALAVTFFVGTIATLSISPSLSNNRAVGIAARDAGMFGAAGIAYLFLHGIFVPSEYRHLAESLPAEWRMSVSLGTIVRKLASLWDVILPRALNLWIVEGLALAPIVGTLALIALVSMAVQWAREPWTRAPGAMGYVALATRVVAILGAGAGTLLPWLLPTQDEVKLRFLFPAMAATVIVVVVALPFHFRRQFPFFFGNWATTAWALLVLVFAAAVASQTTSSNVWNSNTELQFVRNSIAQYDKGEWPRRIHIVRAVDNDTGFNGQSSQSDEFNQKTTFFPQDAADLIRIALIGLRQGIVVPNTVLCDYAARDCEFFTPAEQIIVSQSAYGESVCRSARMIVVDMNILVRATGTGWPRVGEAEGDCENPRLPFDIVQPLADGPHDAKRAFDGSVAPDDFWELETPATLELAFRQPTALQSYSFGRGEDLTRSPAEWTLEASANGVTWIELDRQSLTEGWPQRNHDGFSLENAGQYKHYRFNFARSLHSGLMRVYELVLEKTK